ncbi:glycosyltransferase [Leptolyngbya sp. NIES-2104]|uniref:glycosyltransferase n=1 Tax=Leptolyngbya sp. NIES-2104 TaxID=1552121 RepID=UPI0006ECA462|nr:glycosyltransferase [Leptolyngbya sp. NIES-2104]GAP96063.1 glycosyl transferase, family 2 [Leptolyngbya sp. NIES-2104]
MSEIILGLSIVSLSIWIYLLMFRGQFWQMDQRLPEGTSQTASVCVVIPARNEADLLPIVLRSLLTQSYSGSLNIILVDDHSTDGTAQVAKQTAEMLGKSEQLQILSAQPLPAGWTGKLWALEQGIQKGMELEPDYFLLTDADIEHDSDNLRDLVSHAIENDRELVSLMVRLRCVSFWEKLLIPAFVFFFAKLYPFWWANDPSRSLAAAAGGCSLIQREALTRIGGVAAIRQALIDDCALADAIKSTGSRRIWLGLTPTTISLRPYDSLDTIWNMVSRTAYTQLNYSPLLLIGAVFGMFIVYLLPVVGILTGSLMSLFTYLLMSLSYFPIVQFYRCPFWYAFCLPAIAFLYLLMTIDSAIKHWRGQGGAWKGRTY